MTLLLSGIHGFVGSNLVSALKAHHTIYGLDIISPEKEGVIKTYSWDELTLLPEVDTIIHLAGKAHDTKNKSEAQVYFDINTGLTQKIFDYFLQSKTKQFIFFSSVKAAADTIEGDCLTEDVIPKPVGPYGESKIAAENYILSKERGIAGQARNDREPGRIAGDPESGSGRNDNKHVYILRPCMIHGPGNKGNLNLLYKVVSKGIPYPLGAFENKRSFTSIDNLTFIIEQLLEKNVPSGIYNISDDEPLSTIELIRLIAHVMDKPVRIWDLSPKLIFWLAKIGTVIHFPLNTERMKKLTEDYVVSNAKIKKALDIKQMPVSAIEGFTKTIKSFEKK